MATQERQGDGRATNPGGVYRHKETGAELIATETSKFGNPQADAYVRLGFEYVGPVKGEDKKAVDAMVDPHAAPVASPMGVKSVQELEAELQEAKDREAKFAEMRKEKKDEPKETVELTPVVAPTGYVEKNEKKGK